MGGAFFDGDVTAARDHQLAPLGLTVRELRERPGGVRLPLTTRYRKYARATDDGEVTGFATPRGGWSCTRAAGRARLFPVPVHVAPETDPGGAFPLVLTCAKNGYFCHSQHRA
ncbi:hypothetical protein NKH77_47900 [Streptomyces sp. M19]